MPEMLQTSWDFATTNTQVRNTSNNIITTPGFWLVDLVIVDDTSSGGTRATLSLSDGITSKFIYRYESAGTPGYSTLEQKFVIYVRTGDTVTIQTTDINMYLTSTYRQIADVYGNLVNPLGFTFS